MPDEPIDTTDAGRYNTGERLNEAGKRLQPGAELADADPDDTGYLEADDEREAVWSEAVTDPDEIRRLMDG